MAEHELPEVDGILTRTQVERIGVDHTGPLLVGDVAGREHRAGNRGDVLQIGRGVVERGDARAAPHCLERMTPAAGAEVEEALAAHQPEPVEVDREHQVAKPESRRRFACASSSRR